MFSPIALPIIPFINSYQGCFERTIFVKQTFVRWYIDTVSMIWSFGWSNFEFGSLSQQIACLPDLSLAHPVGIDIIKICVITATWTSEIHIRLYFYINSPISLLGHGWLNKIHDEIHTKEHGFSGYVWLASQSAARFDNPCNWHKF